MLPHEAIYLLSTGDDRNFRDSVLDDLLRVTQWSCESWWQRLLFRVDRMRRTWMCGLVKRASFDWPLVASTFDDAYEAQFADWDGRRSYQSTSSPKESSKWPDDLPGWGWLWRNTFSSRIQRSIALGRSLAGSMAVAVEPLLNITTRTFIEEELQSLALHALLHRLTSGSWPSSLQMLPGGKTDPYSTSGSPYFYEQGEAGIKLWSVGPNHLNEDGCSLTDEPAGDDICVRVVTPNYG